MRHSSLGDISNPRTDKQKNKPDLTENDEISSLMLIKEISLNEDFQKRRRNGKIVKIMKPRLSYRKS